MFAVVVSLSTALLLPVPQVARPFVAQPRHALIHMGWSSPNWNWGSAIGDAHDEAMRIRSELSTPESRIKFLQDNAAEAVPLEDAKMALALGCQRARNLGYDLPGKPWELLMEDMAACKFEGEDGPDKLATAIRAILPPMSQYPDQPPRVMISVALQQMDFVPRGL
jgi:hypothetical protein